MSDSGREINTEMSDCCVVLRVHAAALANISTVDAATGAAAVHNKMGTTEDSDDLNRSN
jgi:hypothetical protein